MLAFMPSIVNQHRRSIDLISDHRRHVRRAADQPHHFRLDVLLLEEATLDRDEIRQRGTHREDAHLDLVLRRRRCSEGRHRGERADKP
jgi:hypothetical protein